VASLRAEEGVLAGRVEFAGVTAEEGVRAAGRVPLAGVPTEEGILITRGDDAGVDAKKGVFTA
jgi:hypothetical protein